MAKIKCSRCGYEGENQEVCEKCGYEFKTIKKIPFKTRVQQIDPVTLMKVELGSLIGGVIGVIAVCIILVVFSPLWYLLFAFVFSIFIQVSQAISKYQQIKLTEMMKKIQTEQIPIEEYLDLPQSKEKIIKDILNSEVETNGDSKPAS